MNDHEMHTSHSFGWAEVLSLIAAVIATAISASSADLRWVSYLAAAALVICIAAMITHFSWWHALRRNIRVQRDYRRLRERFSEHIRLFEDLKSATELHKSLQGLNWNGLRPDCHMHIGNFLQDIDHQFSTLRKSQQVLSYNLAISQVLRIFEGYLRECENGLRSKRAEYESEDEMQEISARFSEYRSTLKEYNSLCREINRNIQELQLREIYPSDLAFFRPSAIQESATKE